MHHQLQHGQHSAELTSVENEAGAKKVGGREERQHGAEDETASGEDDFKVQLATTIITPGSSNSRHPKSPQRGALQVGKVGQFEVVLSTGQKVKEGGVEEDGAQGRRVQTIPFGLLKEEAVFVFWRPKERRRHGEHTKAVNVHLQGKGNAEGCQWRAEGQR